MLVQLGSPVRIADSARRFPRYGNLLGLSGTVTGIDTGTAAGSIATVDFLQKDGSPLEAHVPTRFLFVIPDKKPRQPRKRGEPKDVRTEQEKQDECYRFLTGLGYRVTITGKRPVPATCGACTAMNGRPQPVLCPVHKKVVYSQVGNNGAALADLIITHPERWAKPGERRPSLEQEWKRYENSERQPGQEERAAEGTSAIVWTLRMSLEDIAQFERSLNIEPHPEIIRWLEADKEK